jgi:hypothetical protein
VSCLPLLSVLLARIVDSILTRVISRLIKKTRITIDDEILALLHVPILISIIILGLSSAANRLDFPQTIHIATYFRHPFLLVFVYFCLHGALMD